MVKKIVFTGAPCSGKTEIINLLCEKYQEKFLRIPEVAGVVLHMGFTRDNFAKRRNFQRTIGLLQKAMEKIVEDAACADGDKAVLLDRGIYDIIAYINVFEKKEMTSLVDILGDAVAPHYDYVVHLKTAFHLVEETVQVLNNRIENECDILQLCSSLKAVWAQQHPVFEVEVSTNTIEDKYRNVENLLRKWGIL